MSQPAVPSAPPQAKSLPWPQLLLVAATVIWGSSFLVMKQAVDGMPVFFLLAVRFTGAAAALGLAFWRKWRLLDAAALRGGALLGTLMFAAYTLQTYGLNGLGALEGTTPGKNAFFTAVYCILVPFLGWLLFHRRPDRFHIAAACLCTAGVGLVSLGDGLTLVGGDLLTLLGSVAFALHILAVPRRAARSDIILLTILQFLTMAVLSWAAVLLTHQLPQRSLPAADLWRLGYLALAASCLAMLFQNLGQAHTPPATAAVLLSLEAPFGVLFSVLFGDERPTAAMYGGFALILFAIVLSETKLSFLRRSRPREKKPKIRG